MALAPHTVSATSQALSRIDLAHAVPTRLFVPVFPVGNLSSSCESESACSAADSAQKAFVLQGLFQSHRLLHLSLGQDCILKTKCSGRFCVIVHLLRQCSC